MSAAQVTLIHAGTGNLRSVQKALEASGAAVTLTRDPEQVRRAGKVVLPGVGAFGDFMKGLVDSGLDQPVREIAARGIPLLGICVGMQALFEESEEMGRHPGLGLVPGRVVRFLQQPGLKVPHTGWNQLEICAQSPLWWNLKSGVFVYFNHSYFCLPADRHTPISLTGYGNRFASAVQQENVMGVQFHPEKSQQVGLQILRNFVKI